MSEYKVPTAAETHATRIPADLLAEFWYGFKHSTLAKLQEAFRHSQLSQDEVAARLGKDPAIISRCLRGRTNMTMRTMHDLARAMNCRLRIELDRLDELTPANRRHDATWQWTPPKPETGAPAKVWTSPVQVTAT